MDSFPCAILCRLKLVYSLSVSVPLHETLSSLVCLTRATLRSSKNFEGHLQHYKHNREHAPSIWTSPSLSTALISAASCWADIKHFALKKKEENMRMCKSTLFWKKIHQFSLISHLFFLKKKKKKKKHDWKNTGHAGTLVLLCPIESAVGGEIGTFAATVFSLLNICANCWLKQDFIKLKDIKLQKPLEAFSVFLLI